MSHNYFYRLMPSATGLGDPIRHHDGTPYIASIEGDVLDTGQYGIVGAAPVCAGKLAQAQLLAVFSEGRMFVYDPSDPPIVGMTGTSDAVGWYHPQCGGPPGPPSASVYSFDLDSGEFLGRVTQGTEHGEAVFNIPGMLGASQTVSWSVGSGMAARVCTRTEFVGLHSVLVVLPFDSVGVDVVEIRASGPVIGPPAVGPGGVLWGRGPSRADSGLPHDRSVTVLQGVGALVIANYRKGSGRDRCIPAPEPEVFVDWPDFPPIDDIEWPPKPWPPRVRFDADTVIDQESTIGPLDAVIGRITGIVEAATKKSSGS